MTASDDESIRLYNTANATYFLDYAFLLFSFHVSDFVLIIAKMLGSEYLTKSRLLSYDCRGFRPVKMVHSRKYGVSQICFTHHVNAVLYASKNDWDGM